MLKRRWLFFFPCLVAVVAAAYMVHQHQRQRAALLEKFIQLDQSLATRNQQTQREANATAREIARYAALNRYSAADVQVVKQCRGLLDQTQATVDTLRAVRRRLLAATGNAGPPPWQHPDNAGAVTAFMEGRNGRREAWQLQKQLAAFDGEMKPFNLSLALLADPVLRQPRFGGVSVEFSRFYFEDTPLAAAVANLTLLESRVLEVQTEALRKLNEMFGTYCGGFDKIGAVAVADAEVLAPGSVYKAQLLLGISSVIPSSRWTMSANAQRLPMGPNGYAPVRLLVPPLRAGQPDTVPARWLGAITVNDGLRDTTFRLMVPYLIVTQQRP